MHAFLSDNQLVPECRSVMSGCQECLATKLIYLQARMRVGPMALLALILDKLQWSCSWLRPLTLAHISWHAAILKVFQACLAFQSTLGVVCQGA